VSSPAAPDDHPGTGSCRHRFKKPGTKKATKIPGKNGLRWYKNVGLGFKTPKEAIEGEGVCVRGAFCQQQLVRWRLAASCSALAPASQATASAALADEAVAGREQPLLLDALAAVV
jgi:hypothetical protein